MKKIVVCILIIFAVIIALPYGFYSEVPVNATITIEKSPVDEFFADAPNATVTNNSVFIERQLQFYPIKTANYTPRFNDSVYLPKLLKEKIKKEVAQEKTYYGAAFGIALLVNDYLRYDATFEPESNLSVYEKDPFYCVNQEDSKELLDKIYKARRGTSIHYAYVLIQALKYAGIKSRIVIGIVPGPIKRFKETDTYYLNHRNFTNYIIYPWVEYYDPSGNWYWLMPCDITLAHPAIFEAIPLYRFYDEYPSYYTGTMGNVTVKSFEEKRARIWYMEFREKKYLYSKDVPIIVARYRPSKRQFTGVVITLVFSDDDRPVYLYDVRVIPPGKLVVIEDSSYKIIKGDFLKKGVLPIEALFADRVVLS